MIFFGLNEAALTERARQTLEEIAFTQLLIARERSGMPPRLFLEGHTDRSGSDSYNLALSGRRAEAARAYLISHGYPADDVTVRALGESRPVVKTDDGQREPDNRRVEITFGPPAAP
jgi:outer membrane protein OmpA-like peptidoglycan-associated protein